MKHIFSKYEDDYIIKYYSSKTIKQIANDLNLTDSQVRHRIQRHLNIKPTKRKKHFYNECVFTKDSADKFYILGLIASDGNLYHDGVKNRYKVSISLHSDDVYLLNNINKLLCDTNIVHSRKTVKNSELVMYNQTIYEEVKRYGITEAKSLTLVYPNCIPSQYEKDFIRGYFDGDGSVMLFNDSKSKTYKKLVIQFLGTENLLTGLMNCIYRNVNITPKKIHHTNSKVKRVRYTTKQARTILKWLYDTDSSLRLERKYEKFNQYSVKFND